MIASRKMENLERTAAEFAGLPGEVLPFRCHVGKKEQIEATVAAAEERFGTVDIMVNNGATNLEQGPALDVTDEAVMKMVEINVLSSVRFLRLVVPKMIEKGGGIDHQHRFDRRTAAAVGRSALQLDQVGG